ncbi:MAG: BlaI/MecI/CopY family transcriptional regulator [Sedimentisphaerales bacterium]|jgi:predicted transcriptional regulator|nr:BlaI/MecI/CopY family transcriptional regulator [Sedimentisphaerales bacterium]HNY77443.1 BlaI/MecI/CopY family transcriptional regulator [Sedimentisphaerales bacterium]HOC62847.1 BlaI/MecI/CopY family transcriptional regulator [Sedimentisphaerales bacterium]HOH63667.1 BlaI/MecI/CopY family transcriptional regulator [Sedimentisphaerales bacterium]HPY49814.1 BlaI/MecI/CopY family transcriptional regulator [Sedimentisphaerales bacterium]
MSRHALDDLGQLQRAVMEIIWSRGEATVHQVRDRLDREKELAYTTILTTLQKLERAGWLEHRSEGKSYVYVPRRSREQAGAGSVRGFLKRVFDGNAVAMFQHLIREGDLSEDELKELRRIIDEKRKEMRG